MYVPASCVDVIKADRKKVFGWWTLAASQLSFMTQFTLHIKALYVPGWWGANTGWLEFVVFVGLTALLTVVNAVSCRKDPIMPWINNFTGIWFTALFVVLSLAMLIPVGIKKELTYQSAKFAFGGWINKTGWPDGVVWFTGLVQAAYGLTAFDSVIHMVEEIPKPRVLAPRVITLAISFGAITGFIFMLVCLFCMQDVDKVTTADLPFIELLLETVGFQGAVALTILFILNGVCQSVSIVLTASRLTWGFSRDGGMLFSGYLSHVNETWKVPARALWFQGCIISLVGILYLFSSTVLQAILSVSTIALTISYALPILTLQIIGRDNLPPGGKFGLGRWGTVINWISIVYCAITTVFFFFPGTPSPSPGNMNYAIAVFGVMLIISVSFWFIQGQKTYLNTEDAIADMLHAQQLEQQRTIEEEQRPKSEKHEKHPAPEPEPEKPVTELTE